MSTRAWAKRRETLAEAATPGPALSPSLEAEKTFLFHCLFVRLYLNVEMNIFNRI